MQSNMFKDAKQSVIQPKETITCFGCKEEEEDNEYYMFSVLESVCDPCLQNMWNRVGKYFVAGGGLEGNMPARTAINCMHRRSATINTTDSKLYCDDCLTEIEFNE